MTPRGHGQHSTTTSFQVPTTSEEDSDEVISMQVFQQVMYGFFAVLMLAALAIAAWFYKKQKENDR